MNWRQYQNELIALAALLLLLFAYIYKHNQVTAQTQGAQQSKQTVEEFKEVIALKKVWADKKISKKVKKLETLVPASKIKWSNKSKKVTAIYTGLNSNEVNKLISSILNIPIIIRLLDIQKMGDRYNVEFKCKW